MDPHDIIIKPILTEKTTFLAEMGKYAFRVHKDSNKLDIQRAVEELFRVDVVAVNVLRVRGKWRRFGRSRGRRSDWKKAVVTLQAGQSIELFPGT